MLQGNASSASSKELATLRDENEALKKQNAKMAYRIQHLVGTVEMLLATQSNREN
jgi:FtsZ-binding cell division protein ZapB